MSGYIVQYHGHNRDVKKNFEITWNDILVSFVLTGIVLFVYYILIGRKSKVFWNTLYGIIIIGALQGLLLSLIKRCHGEEKKDH
jgi:Na+/pantothenate symporter